MVTCNGQERRIARQWDGWEVPRLYSETVEVETDQFGALHVVVLRLPCAFLTMQTPSLYHGTTKG